MEIKTSASYLNQSIFGENQGQVGFGYHNVGRVFVAGNQDLIRTIDNHYGQRCGHLPDTEGIGILVGKSTSVIESQANYLAKLLGREAIQIQTVGELNGQHQGALVVPYINESETAAFLSSHGMEIWGLSPRLVDVLKNKADSHELIRRLDVPGFAVPEYQIHRVDEIPERAMSYLDKLHQVYIDTGMSRYPLGLMFRGAESGGNFGACFVKEEGSKIVLIPNGDSKERRYYQSWEETLPQVREYLKETANSNLEIEPRVVVSRFMDLADSPGLSVVILDGHVFPLGWNGQVQAEESSACIGTSSYSPKSDGLRYIQDKYEHSTESAFETFLRAASNDLGIDFSTQRGVANVDLMIPGPAEVEFQRRLGRQPQITVAEINPRFTNWTDALLLVAGANGRKKSISEIKDVIQTGVLTINDFPLPSDADLSYVREIVYELDQKMMVGGTRVILRMSDNPMGLIFTGDTELARTQLEQRLVISQ